MLSIKKIISDVATHLMVKLNVKAKILATKHFNERLIQRFEEDQVIVLEKVIEKAFEKATPGAKITYTHPYYHMTVVGKKIGVNGFELITCWQKDEDAE